MKKVLLILALLMVLALLAVFVGARILGPKLISVVAPNGTPIGEYDLPKPETSLLGLGIAIPVSLLDEIANAEVPPTFQGSETKNFHKRIKQGAYAWDVTRGPIAFRNTGSAIAFTMPFEGKATLEGELDAAILTVPLNGNAALGGKAGGTMTPEASSHSPVRRFADRPSNDRSIPSAFVTRPGPECSPTPRISTAAGTPSRPVTMLSIQCMP